MFPRHHVHADLSVRACFLKSELHRCREWLDCFFAKPNLHLGIRSACFVTENVLQRNYLLEKIRCCPFVGLISFDFELVILRF